jgi:hypothetical protein
VKKEERTPDGCDTPLVQLFRDLVGDVPPRHECLDHHAVHVCRFGWHLEAL